MKKVKVGIIGIGRLGSRHAMNLAFRIPNAELSAVCSVIPEELKRAKEEWGIENCYSSYERLLNHPDLDAVAIVSPSKLHCEHIIKALDKGLHVFSEKPLGISAEEIDKIEAAVARHPKQILQLGYMRRFDPSYADAKQKIQEGAIGDVFLIKCNSLDPAYGWPADSIYRFSPNSGGLFNDLAVHDFDLARWFLESEPASVYAIGGNYVFTGLDKLGDVDNAAIAMQFDHNKMALFHSSRTAAEGYHVETEVFGTKGAIRISPVSARNLNYLYDEHGVRQEPYRWFLERFELAYLNEMQAFINCVQNGTLPAVNLFDGRQATNMANAANQSLQTNQVVFFHK